MLEKHQKLDSVDEEEGVVPLNEQQDEKNIRSIIVSRSSSSSSRSNIIPTCKSMSLNNVGRANLIKKQQDRQPCQIKERNDCDKTVDCCSFISDSKNEEHVKEYSVNASSLIQGTPTTAEYDRDEFANKRSAMIVAYVLIWVCFYLLVHHHGGDRTQPTFFGNNRINSGPAMTQVNSANCILYAEFVKMSVSTGLLLKQCGVNDFIALLQPCYVVNVMLRNLRVAWLYTIYYNLMFINLKHNSPTVYLLVASSRLIMKSIVWQIQFKVSMSRGKQMSLLLIILGIMSQCFNYNAASAMEAYSLSDSTNVQSMETGNSRSIVLIVIQMMFSVMISVYNQRGVVKDGTFNEYLESIGLHVNSVVINMIISVCMLASRSDSSSRDASSVDWFGWKQWISSLDTLVIIISLAVGGSMSSQMMRYENSIVKGVVSASEIIIVAIIQYVLFKDTLSLSDVMGILLVTVGTMLYRMPNQCSVERVKKIAKCSFFELVISGCSLLVLICCLVMARNGKDGGLDSWSTSFRTKELSKHQYTVSSAQKHGIVACISSRANFAEAFALASFINELNQNTTSIMRLELYHNVSLSYYLTGKLESNTGVSVIDLTSFSSSSPCLVEAMMVTSLKDIVLVDTSIVLFSSSSLHDTTASQSKDGVHICGKGKRRNNSFGSVISTSLDLDESLQLLKSRYETDGDIFSHKFCKAYFHENQTGGDDNYVFTKIGNSSHSALLLGPIVYTKTMKQFPLWHSYIHAYMYPVWNDFDKMSYYYDSPLFCGTSPSLVEVCDENLSLQIKQNWIVNREAYSFLLFDQQPLSWVAFDGGIAPAVGNSSCISFNSVCSAKNSVLAGGGSARTVLNIDLVRLSDGVNIAMHSKVAYGPIEFETNTPPHPYDVQSMTVSEAKKKLRNPCLPVNVAQTWLDPNSYRLHHLYDFNCTNDCFQSIDTEQDFLDRLVLEDNVEIIFDLKSPNGTDQLQQAQHLLSLIQQKSDSEKEMLLDKVALRFFDVGLQGEISLGILPSFVQESVVLGEFPSQLKTYFNAPSRQACSVLEKWTMHYNVTFGGCFILQDDESIMKNWQDLATTMFHSSKFTISLQNHVKVICDVPRKQEHPNTKLWSDGLSTCVENGYQWIHHPFPISSSLSSSIPNFDMPPSFLSKTSLVNQSIIEKFMTMEKSNLEQTSKKNSLTKQALSKWDNYISHWAVTSAYDWRAMNTKKWSFSGNKDITTSDYHQNLNQQNQDKLIFRCVSKILTVMLFLRLEEENILSIDNLIMGIPYNVTWKQVFSNTAGRDGKKAGNEFTYANELWLHVPEAIYNATGLSFEETIKYYVLDPMGLSGSFDNQTAFPPVAARGFVGSLDDLMLIGCTLATGGISPKTSKRVLSTQNIQKMQRDWITPDQGVMNSFQRNIIVFGLRQMFTEGNATSNFFPFRMMNHHPNSTNATTNDNDENDNIAAYGMGMWLVKGWRRKGGAGGKTVPVQGWLALGGMEAAVYFDSDGVVVGMLAPQNVVGLKLDRPFFKFVRQVGSIMEESFQEEQSG